MTQVIVYEIEQKENYSLQQLVNSFCDFGTVDDQGIIVNEYDSKFIKATYWKQKVKRERRYNLEKRDFEFIEEQIVDVADFVIQLMDKKLLVLGNKQMAQRIITLIGITSDNSYIISEYIIDIEKIINKICNETEIYLLKVELMDIPIEKDILVNCSVNLEIHDNPKSIILKYVKNTTVISFMIAGLATPINIYKHGKFSIGKIDEDDKDEIIQKIIKMMC
ncbi:hypothetical protein AB840_08190 [Megasphaera cerevisiae DSM 20462]|uniref:Uncharacterized protein n=1 Tax=Megasphaera cerevisiae DSM 20462 TaxID=1122219 RepID=A0A0J6WV47_9FIRM|nr:hypothetical protein [Megasphaera cerevisiae]KMO86434.1 hypothetical protein AB840_08190 [Megasphaera cerevisiae DSM 20462]SJZ72899.1 hypothetical protein SAMN05660900_01292 [Megasphaera cerevisiae DSM 20462]